MTRRRRDNGSTPPQPDVLPKVLRGRYGFDHKKALGTLTPGSEGKPDEIKPFSHRPITITMTMVDLDSREEYWELTWVNGDGRRSHRVEREIAKNPTKLGKVDAYGLPSIPGQLRPLARFLSEVENEVPIPRGYVTKHFGWQRGTDEVDRWFLWGATPLTKAGEAAPPLELIADDNTLRGLVEACHSKGSLAGWKRAVKPVEAFPPVVVALLTALASPLLRVLHAAPFITDLAAKTSTGKTVALTIAGSAVGQPEAKGNNRGSVVQMMKSASNVGFEVISATMGSLPVLVDDSKTAKNRSLIEKFIYQQASGSGALRGTPEGGVRDTHKWLTTCITTGESPLATNTEAGGAAARVLSISERPFGPKDEATGRLVQELRDKVTANYGWALPALVQYLLDHQDDWKRWREELDEEEVRFLDLASGADEEVRRQSEFMAVLSMTGRIAVAADVLPFDPADAIETAWRRMVAGGENNLDKPRKAMSALRSWLNLNLNRVYDNRERETHPKVIDPNVQDFADSPPGGWLGVIDNKGRGDFIAIAPEQLRAVLEKLGYRLDEVRHAWLDYDWLDRLPSEPTKTAMKYRPPGASAAGRYLCVLLEKTDDL